MRCLTFLDSFIQSNTGNNFLPSKLKLSLWTLSFVKAFQSYLYPRLLQTRPWRLSLFKFAPLFPADAIRLHWLLLNIRFLFLQLLHIEHLHLFKSCKASALEVSHFNAKAFEFSAFLLNLVTGVSSGVFLSLLLVLFYSFNTYFI